MTVDRAFRDCGPGSEPLLSGPSTFTFALKPAGHRQPGPGEALVRVLAGGICGSDLPLFRGAPVPDYVGSGRPPAGYPMHEIVGYLQAVGPGTPAAAPLGARVVGWATGFDGLASEVITDAASIAPCPDRWSPEDAVLIQPLACVLYAVERIGDVTDRHCAVIGLGPIGLLFCHVLKQLGAARVTGVDQVDRSDVATEFGIDDLHWASAAQWASELDSQRPDVVVEAVGHQVSTLQDALTAAAPSGVIFYFGVSDDAVYPLDMGLMLRKNLTLMSGGTSDRTRMLIEAAVYLENHPDLVEHAVTDRFERADVQRAYALAATPARGRLKVVVTVSRS